MILDKIDDTRVFEYFEEICNIPRGSGNNKGISDYLVGFAKKNNLRYVQDEFENVVIWKDATEGMEDKPGVILQGHMDMVCEKEADVEHNFITDPLELGKADDFIYAKGTTLGGDDGIALAYGLAILSDEKLQHPALEVVFTTDEETGMNGAIGLDVSELKGKYFINIDSEEEGTFLTSCAGGMSVNGLFSEERNKMIGTKVTMRVLGLQGGHSGTEIDKKRENATLIVGRILNEIMRKKISYSLVSIEGGQKDNAIPREAVVEFMVSEKDGECVKSILKESSAFIQREIKIQEPDFEVEVSFEEKKEEKTYSKKLSKDFVFFLNHVPNGVQKMSGAIEGLVESSLNLGICNCTEKGIFVSFSLRSSIQTYKEYMCEQLKSLIELLGGEFARKSEYPAWEYRIDSKLRDIMIKVYKEQYGKEPKVEAIHAGLECGIISGKLPELDIVSMGPDILDIHTPKERLSISSTQRVYRYLCQVLKVIE